MTCARAALAALLLAGATAASAQVKYQPDGLLRNGYSDKAIAAGVWEVKGTSGEHEGGVAVALYRAAELAQASGVAELRVTRQEVRTRITTLRNTLSEINYHESATVTVRAVSDDADRRACDMVEPARCMTLSVAGLMARFGPMLGRAAPAGAVPAPIVTTAALAPGAERLHDWAALRAMRRWTRAGTGWRGTPAGDTTADVGAGTVQTPPVLLLPSAAPPSIPSIVATSLPPTGVATAPAAVVPAGRMVRLAMPAADAAPEDVLAARLRAAGPVRGRDPIQGWSVSD